MGTGDAKKPVIGWLPVVLLLALILFLFVDIKDVNDMFETFVAKIAGLF
jgi:hypothetical protein